jgi:hypothetical protein
MEDLAQVADPQAYFWVFLAGVGLQGDRKALVQLLSRKDDGLNPLMPLFFVQQAAQFLFGYSK